MISGFFLFRGKVQSDPELNPPDSGTTDDDTVENVEVEGEDNVDSESKEEEAAESEEEEAEQEETPSEEEEDSANPEKEVEERSKFQPLFFLDRVVAMERTSHRNQQRT